MRLKRNFYNRDTLIVAKELLGKYLVRRVFSTDLTSSTSSGQAARVIRAKIIETEAYCGLNDLANHASRGLTPRTKVMFGPAGFTYVYLIYGMYNCLNIVTEKEGYPAAVLIRGVNIINGLPRDGVAILRGPGKVCRELKIDRSLNNIDIVANREIWIEEGGVIKSSQIKKGKRIGIDYAGSYKNKLWRFYIKT